MPKKKNESKTNVVTKLQDTVRRKQTIASNLDSSGLLKWQSNEQDSVFIL